MKKLGDGKLLNKRGERCLSLSPLPEDNLRFDDLQKKLKAGVNVAGTAAIRQITRDVFKFTRLIALRAVQGRFIGGHGVAALGALPMGFRFLCAHRVVLLCLEGLWA